MTKQEMAALFARAGGVERVTIAGVELEVVELSFGARVEMAAFGDDGASAMRHAIKRSCYTPGTVERPLDDELIDLLPQDEVMRLFEVVKRLSGIESKPALAADPDVETSIHEPSEAEKNG